jgi:hypothetical protein
MLSLNDNPICRFSSHPTRVKAERATYDHQKQKRHQMYPSETSIPSSLPKYPVMYSFGRLSVLEGSDIRRLANGLWWCVLRSSSSGASRSLFSHFPTGVGRMLLHRNEGPSHAPNDFFLHAFGAVLRNLCCEGAVVVFGGVAYPLHWW